MAAESPEVDEETLEWLRRRAKAGRSPAYLVRWGKRTGRLVGIWTPAMMARLLEGDPPTDEPVAPESEP